jgi:carboxypeptidase T
MSLHDVYVIAKDVGHLRELAKLKIDAHFRAARQEEENRIVVPAVLSKGEIAKVEKAGYSVRIGEDVSDWLRLRQAEVHAGNRFEERPGELEPAAFQVMGYLNEEEVEASLKQLSQRYPNLVKLIPLPERTWEGRLSHAVRLGAGDVANRPGLLFTGSMHAREWGGSDICVGFLQNTISSYANNSPVSYGEKTFSADQIRTIVEKLNVYVFPDVNPDGKHYSQTVDPGSGERQGEWWRWNRNPNTDVDSRNPGVDLNRNFDFLWGSGIGTSSVPGDWEYKGTNAESEPEILNVVHLFDNYEEISCYVDIHSYGELIMYSWGDDDNQEIYPNQHFRNEAFDGKRGRLRDDVYGEYLAPGDREVLERLGNRMNDALRKVRNREYEVKPSSGLYATTATSSDYAFSRYFTGKSKHKIYGFTIEFGPVRTRFVPEYNEMRHIVEEVSAALTELCWTVVSNA